MTTLGSGFVALIVPAFVRVFKKYIPGGYVGPVYLSASVLFGIIAIAIAATGGFDGTCTWGIALAGVVALRRPCTCSSTKHSMRSCPRRA